MEAENSRDVPAVGEHVELTFEDKYGNQSSICGRVTEVDTDPDGLGNELFIGVDNGENNKEIQYYEGMYPDIGENAFVFRWSDFTGSHNLGDNAEWRRLE